MHVEPSWCGMLFTSFMRLLCESCSFPLTDEITCHWCVKSVGTHHDLMRSYPRRREVAVSISRSIIPVDDARLVLWISRHTSHFKVSISILLVRFETNDFCYTEFCFILRGSPDVTVISWTELFGLPFGECIERALKKTLTYHFDVQCLRLCLCLCLCLYLCLCPCLCLMLRLSLRLYVCEAKNWPFPRRVIGHIGLLSVVKFIDNWMTYEIRTRYLLNNRVGLKNRRRNVVSAQCCSCMAGNHRSARLVACWETAEVCLTVILERCTLFFH